MTEQRDPGKHRSWWRALAVLGGVGAAVALGSTAVLPASAASRASAAGSTRTVTYHGYTVSVPASWPVYNLADDPHQCVLFNKHAVYLGPPGASQDCPARAYGRTDALLIQPSGPGVVVTASYGTDPGTVRRILAGATLAGSAAIRATPSTAATPTAAMRATAPTAATRAAAAGRAALTEMTGTGLGFDACTAPSVATMTAWLASPYRVAATYLGGSNWACGYGNFSASWVQRVAAEGWKFLPLWVGPQAPCTTLRGVTVIHPARAAAQGQQEAATAAAAARGFGYSRGTPVYFDMESYNNSNSACSRAVLAFLGGWTRGLRDAGYLSGVYSSAATGIRDLAGRYGTGYPSPAAAWIADWNLEPVLADRHVPDADWASHQRVHQYEGGHKETWGGATVDIDSDFTDGPAAGSPARAPLSGTAAVAEPDETAVAPGGTTAIRVTLRGTGSTTGVLRWRADAPAGLHVWPARGTAVVRPGTSASFPLAVSPSRSLADRRYDVPITVTWRGKPVGETFELVSVTRARRTLPTPYPVVLYAADEASMAVAARTARRLALPARDVTGDFSQAWSDLTGGGDLVLAVGQAADNGLYSNPCGWANPAGKGAGHTPFSIPGEPLQGPPGADAFEESDGGTSTSTALLTGQLIQYALAGTLPDYGNPPAGPLPPTSACLGSPHVAVPSFAPRSRPPVP